MEADYTRPAGVTLLAALAGLGVAWNGFLLHYLCRESVTHFFGTAGTRIWKALLIVFAVCIGIFAVGSILAML
ncbi:hypothetical protein ACFFK0_24930 [Paenibacillus chartarius]|uniref:Uncharacterized protein n=1 Tax=Paenibacillus chartarius TaxID=747481 RepID=A0ABV6DSM3_9BACL